MNDMTRAIAAPSNWVADHGSRCDLGACDSDTLKEPADDDHFQRAREHGDSGSGDIDAEAQYEGFFSSHRVGKRPEQQFAERHAENEERDDMLGRKRRPDTEFRADRAQPRQQSVDAHRGQRRQKSVENDAFAKTDGASHGPGQLNRTVSAYIGFSAEMRNLVAQGLTS